MNQLRSEDIAVLISTYNWPEALALSIKSVCNQTILPAEILIADDGSGVETKEMIERIRQTLPSSIHLKHIWHEDRGFRAAGIRNKAIAATSKTYIVQIDGDCIMESHFIEDHIKMATPGHFIAGSRVILNEADTKAIISAQHFDPKLTHISFGHKLNTIRITPLRKLLAPIYKRNNVWAARGANISYSRQDIVKVNGYDESFVGWGYEDSELCFRFYNVGLRHLTLKFGGVLYHLHHKERSRDKADQLKAMAIDVLKKGKKWADVGLDTCSER